MDRIQLRRDTAANWVAANPVLLEGEVGYETDTNLRKIGDGVHSWKELNYLRAEGIVQETGDGENVVMSQKAVSEKLTELGSEVRELNLYIIGNTIITKKEGVVVDDSGVIVNATGLYNSFLVPAIEGNKYTVNISGGTKTSTYMLSDMYVVGTSENIIGKTTSDNIIPKGCRYLLVGTYNTEYVEVTASHILIDDVKKEIEGLSKNKKKLFSGKTISIVGDSISTFTGSENTFYPNSDVNSIDKTWWSMFVNRTDGILGENKSAGSSRVTNTYSYVSSQIQLVSAIEECDVLVLAGGVNDSYGYYAEIGIFDPSKNEEDLDESLFAEAYDKYVRIGLTKAERVICLITSKVGKDYVPVIKNIASYYDVVCIDLTAISSKIGLIDAVHPNYEGMQMMCEYMINSYIGLDISNKIAESLNGELKGKAMAAEIGKTMSDTISITSNKVGNIDLLSKIFSHEVYRNDFMNDIISTEVSEFSIIKNDDQMNHIWEKGSVTLKNIHVSGGSYGVGNIYIQSPISLSVPSFIVEGTVVKDHESSDGTGTIAHVGFVKDKDNFCVVEYNKYQKAALIVVNASGSISSERIEYISLEAPYTIGFAVDGNLTNAYLKKDGVMYYLGERWIGGVMQFDNPSTLRTYKPSLGCVANYATKDLSYSSIRCFYTSGLSFGADFHVATYEDGTPIIKDGYLYFTSSIHSNTAYGQGISIYRVPQNGYVPELVSILYFKSNTEGWYFGGGSSDILYDRNSHTWIVQVTNFKSTLNQCYIGKTNKNILNGYHIIEVQLMDIPDKDTHAWDFDIVYINNKWTCVYSNNLGLVKCTSDDVLGAWNLETTNTNANVEGAVIFKCGGKYYFSTTNREDLGLDVYLLETLEKVGVITTDKWCHNVESPAPHSWGSIVPISEGSATSFYMYVFSGRRFEGLTYGYGDLWIYKAKETELGNEHNLIFNGIEEVSVDEITNGNLLPTALNFVASSVKHVGIF